MVTVGFSNLGIGCQLQKYQLLLWLSLYHNLNILIILQFELRNEMNNVDGLNHIYGT